MKQIQILGTGCAKCDNLSAVAEAAAKSTGEPNTIGKITDLTNDSSPGSSRWRCS